MIDMVSLTLPLSCSTDVCEENSFGYFPSFPRKSCQSATYTLEMVLLTGGRINCGGFLCLPNPFLILTLLVTEFVVSPTHGFTTFSSYGSMSILDCD